MESFLALPASYWIILGIVLLIAEVGTGTLFLLFFGISALLTGGVAYVGVQNISVQIVFFAVASVGLTLTLRKRLRSMRGASEGFVLDQGSKVTIVKDVMPEEAFEVMYQGTVWQAVNNTGRVLRAQETANIAKIDGVKLIIR